MSKKSTFEPKENKNKNQIKIWISKHVTAGVIFGLAAVATMVVVLAFTEPVAGPSIAEPTAETDTGKLQEIIGTPNAITQSASTLFNYLRMLEKDRLNTDAAVAPENETDAGKLQDLLGASATAPDRTTIFNYIHKLYNDLANLTVGNLKKNVIMGDLTGDYPSTTYPLPGDTGGDGNDATTAADVRYGLEAWTKAGEKITGGMSHYPNTPSGISGLNQNVCENIAVGWEWRADSNYDGVEDDPICVQGIPGPNMRWSTNNVAPYNQRDNTFIGNYSCSDSEDNLETFDPQLNGKVVENDGYGDDTNTAVAAADCKDGIRNLLSKNYVESFGYTVPDVTCESGLEGCYEGPLTKQVLAEWKGTRLPTIQDFFGVCGNGTDSTTFGDYGYQVGRTDNVITAGGSAEHLSDVHGWSYCYSSTQYACSATNYNHFSNSHALLRVIFRP